MAQATWPVAWPLTAGPGIVLGTCGPWGAEAAGVPPAGLASGGPARRGCQGRRRARQRPRGEVGKPQARQEEGGPHPGTSLAVKWGARGAALPSSRGTGKRFGQKRGRTARWDRDFSLLFSRARFHGVALTCPRHTADVRRPALPAAPARGASDPVLTGTGRADAHFPPRARAWLASSLGSPAASCLTAPAGPARSRPHRPERALSPRQARACSSSRASRPAPASPLRTGLSRLSVGTAASPARETPPDRAGL